MFGFKSKREREYARLSVEEKSEAANVLLHHLVDVATAAMLDGSEDARDAAVRHISNDLDGNPPALVQATLGRAVLYEAEAQANAVRQEASEAIQALLKGDPWGLSGEETAADAPTDLLPDGEPVDVNEAVQQAYDAADEKVWSEDRR